MKKSRFSFFVTLAVVAFLYLPIVVLVLSSFNPSRFGGGMNGFSLKWYYALFDDKELWLALSNSLLIGFGAALTSTVLGTLSALALWKYRGVLQNLHAFLLYSPLVVPDLLMAVSLLLFFVSLALPFGLFSVYLAHTTFCLSYVTTVVLARLEQMEPSLLEAAYDLGASTYQAVVRVLLPCLLPGILSGALLAFTLSLDDFVITYFVSGKGTATLPVYIYGMMKFGATPTINALSTVLLGLTFLAAYLSQKTIREL